MNVLEAITIRRSVRKYDPRPIPADSEKALLTALRSAPSAINYQPWRFILVKDAELRQKLAETCNKQTWMAQAPLVVVACGFADQAYKKMGGYGNSVDIDLAIALDHLSLAAVEQGLGTCWIGAFNEQAVKILLKVPPEAKIVALMPVGFPQSPDLNHPLTEDRRKPSQDIFSADTYM